MANRRKLGSIGVGVGPKPDRLCTKGGAIGLEILSGFEGRIGWTADIPAHDLRQYGRRLSLHISNARQRSLQNDPPLFNEMRLHLGEGIIGAVEPAPIEINKILELALVPVKPSSAEGKDDARISSPIETAFPDFLFEFERVFQHPPAPSDPAVPGFSAHPVLEQSDVNILRKPLFSLGLLELFPSVRWHWRDRFDIHIHAQTFRGDAAKVDGFCAARKRWFIGHGRKARLCVQ